MEHEHVHPGAPRQRVDRRRSGVARGRADDGQMFVAAGQEAFEQEPEELQRDILERQCRPVEQFEQPMLPVELNEWSDGGMAETAICLRAQCAQIVARQHTRDERRHDLDGGVDIRQTAQGGDLLDGQRRPGFGQIQAAIAGEASQRHRLEIENGRIAPGAYVAHRAPAPSGRGACRQPRASSADTPPAHR